MWFRPWAPIITSKTKPGGVAALRPAREIDGKLVYVGKIGIGFTRKGRCGASQGARQAGARHVAGGGLRKLKRLIPRP